MKTTALLFALPVSLALLASGPVFAQAAGCGEERDVGQGLLDEPVWKRLNESYELVGEERYNEAYDLLLSIRSRARDNDTYLKSVIAQAIAQVEWSRENYDAALKEFELAVELDALPDKTHYGLMYQIAQLYYMQERFDDALQRLDMWFCKVPPENIKSSAYVLKASIYASREDWPEVIKAIDQAIAMDEKPQESWYQLKLAAHYELNQFPAAASTLETMVSKWPNKKSYWVQLSNTWFKLEDDAKALSTIALAYRKDLLENSADLMYLANLYSLRDVPFKAAEVMQKGMEDGHIEQSEKHWTMTADSWYAAEEMERALAGYEQAGRLASDGKIDLRRGYILIDMERWEEANAALTAALEKGGIDERKIGEAWLMKGMAEFNMGNFDAASSNWGKASRYDSSKQAAQQWMNHLREERARRAP